MKKIFNLYTFTLFKLIIFNFLSLGKNKLGNFIYKNYKNSYSQIFQDLFVIFSSKQKKNGFFNKPWAYNASANAAAFADA